MATPNRKPWLSDHALGLAVRVAELVGSLAFTFMLLAAALKGDVAQTIAFGFLLLAVELGAVRRSL